MKQLPDDVVAYKKTDVFNESNIPKGLLKNHSTKPDVWGKIHVLEGKLLYVIETKPPEEIELTPKIFGVVEPEVPHFVKAQGPVRFFVEFLQKAPDSL